MLDLNNKWFCFHGWRNNKRSGEPFGFWLMWKPRQPTTEPKNELDRLWRSKKFTWLFSFYWYYGDFFPRMHSETNA